MFAQSHHIFLSHYVQARVGQVDIVTQPDLKRKILKSEIQ